MNFWSVVFFRFCADRHTHRQTPPKTIGLPARSRRSGKNSSIFISKHITELSNTLFCLVIQQQTGLVSKIRVKTRDAPMVVYRLYNIGRILVRRRIYRAGIETCATELTGPINAQNEDDFDDLAKLRTNRSITSTHLTCDLFLVSMGLAGVGHPS